MSRWVPIRAARVRHQGLLSNTVAAILPRTGSASRDQISITGIDK